MKKSKKRMGMREWSVTVNTRPQVWSLSYRSYMDLKGPWGFGGGGRLKQWLWKVCLEVRDKIS